MSKFARRRLIVVITVAVLILGTVAVLNRSALRSGFDQLVGNDYRARATVPSCSKLSRARQVSRFRTHSLISGQ
jgi:hypothetical protein